MIRKMIMLLVSCSLAVIAIHPLGGDESVTEATAQSVVQPMGHGTGDG